MTLFFERFTELCTNAGSSPNAEAKKLNIPSGSVTAWKNGAIPRTKTIQKIAEHFGVSAPYLMGWAREPDDMDKAVLEKYPGLRLGYETIQEYLDRIEAEKKKDPEPSQPAKSEVSEADIKFALFGGSGEITDEMYEEVKKFARFVKQQHDEQG